MGQIPNVVLNPWGRPNEPWYAWVRLPQGVLEASRFTSEKVTYAYGRVVLGRSYCNSSAGSCQRDPKCLKLRTVAC